MERPIITNTQLISGFWLWVILIIDNPNGVDLLDAIIAYIGRL